MKKRITALILSMAMAASFAACSKDDDKDETTAETTDSVIDTEGEEFVKIDVVPSAIDPENLTDWYFNAVTSHHSGTAGYSLGMAEAAYNIYHEAAMNDLSAVDSETLSANLLEAWEGLSSDDQAAFDENILYIANLITSAQEDWEANKGLFEDAGVDTLMIDVLNMDGADEDWSALLGQTLTIGNG